MKYVFVSLILLIFFCISFESLSQEETTVDDQSEAQRIFRMICRGPLNYSTGIGGLIANYRATIDINKNSRRAGEDGRYLRKGTCAWKDRPLNRNEPLIIKVDEITVEGLGHKARMALNPAFLSFVNCNFDQRCTFSLGVKRDTTTNVFLVQYNDIRINFPVFQ